MLIPSSEGLEGSALGPRGWGGFPGLEAGARAAPRLAGQGRAHPPSYPGMCWLTWIRETPPRAEGAVEGSGGSRGAGAGLGRDVPCGAARLIRTALAPALPAGGGFLQIHPHTALGQTWGGAAWVAVRGHLAAAPHPAQAARWHCWAQRPARAALRVQWGGGQWDPVHPWLSHLGSPDCVCVLDSKNSFEDVVLPLFSLISRCGAELAVGVCHTGLCVHQPDITGLCDVSVVAQQEGTRALGDRRVLSKGYRQLRERRMRNEDGEHRAGVTVRC